MVVGALGQALGHCGGKFIDHAALVLDSLVGGLDAFDHFSFAHFEHLALHHHHVAGVAGHDQVDVSALHLLEGRVHRPLAFVADHADLAYGAIERDVANGDGGGSGQAGQRIAGVLLVGAHQADLHLGVAVEVVVEERAQGTVHKAAYEDLPVAGAVLTFEEAAGKTSGSAVLFAVFHLQRQEIDALAGFLGGHYGGEDDGVAATDGHAAVGLLGEDARL